MAKILLGRCSCCKSSSIVQCDGCFKWFCSTHFREHRQNLDTQFEQRWHDRNVGSHPVMDHLSKVNKSQLRTLRQDIDQWEQQALQSVKQSADRVRNRIDELTTLRTNNIKNGLDRITEQMDKNNKEINYFEYDFMRLNERFRIILNDLNLCKSRMKTTILPIKWSSPRQSSIEQDSRHRKQYFSNGTLLSTEHQFQLNEFYGKRNQTWKLIYKGTRHGFSSIDFHRCCDRKGPTLSVLKSTSGHVFGGYTSVDWESCEEWLWSIDTDAFLFTLTNPHPILPTKYEVNTEGRNAVGCKTSMGPTFGRWDICIYSNSNQNARNHIMFPSNYIDSTGKGRLTFTGSHYFKIRELEVYVPEEK